MKRFQKILFSCLLCLSINNYVAYGQGIVMIVDKEYSCPDPRIEDSTWTFHKGDAVHVFPTDNGYDYFGPYTAACVSLPKDLCHLPGSVRGEKCIVVNATKVRLRQGPSTQSGIYCIDALQTGSVSHAQFRPKQGKEVDADGNVSEWIQFFFNKGTRLPYLGKFGAFYKSRFNDIEFYISAKHTYLR